MLTKHKGDEMSVSRRLYYEYRVYHVIARGNNREYIFEDNYDKEIFMDGIRKYQERLGFKVYAYVIMGNHFHLLIETSEGKNISKIMQGILLSYSCRYRKKYGRVGHVWQGRFKSKAVVNEHQMLENIKYIHENPLRAKMVNAIDEYRWSSAKFYNEPKSLSEDLIKLTKWGTVLSETIAVHRDI
jgi:REP element-mobilizing transposase RayT